MFRQFMKNEVMCGIIAVLIIIPAGACLSAATPSSTVEPRLDSTLLGGSRNLTIYVTGTMGNNGWFVSNVVITITSDDGVNHTYYKLHENDSWTEYTAPITVSTDGIYEANAYCVGTQGEEEHASPVPFKIDKTPPWVELNQTIRFWRWSFTIHVHDNMSGPGPVTIYIDNVLVGNLTVPPFSFQWRGPVWLILWKYKRTGDTSLLPAITAYDMAGNSAQKHATTLRLP